MDTGASMAEPRTSWRARSPPWPRLIFWRCLELMARERVQLPGEHRLTALIATALQRRKHQLARRIEQLMTAELRDRLDDLFVQPTPAADGTEPGRTSRYRLTLL